MNIQEQTKILYKEMGISEKVYAFGTKILDLLSSTRWQSITS